ncbi:cupin domain-containing protein [Cytobacillus sp. Hm23]
MKVLDLVNTPVSASKLEVIFKSASKSTALFECVLLPQEEIKPHIHSFGEDCAVVLSGELTYYVSNNQSITATEGDLVLGWKNVIQGYKNNTKNPLHLLIFASPREFFISPTAIEYKYVADDDPIVIHLPIEKRIIRSTQQRVEESQYSSFSTLQIEGVHQGEYNKEMQAFVDYKNKRVYIYEDESVELPVKQATYFIKYEYSYK